IFRDIDHYRSGTTRPGEVISFAHHGSKVADVSHQVVVFNAWSGDAHCVDFLEGIGANQMPWYLTSNHYYWGGIHIRIGNSGNGIRGAGAGSHQRSANATSRPRVTFRHVHCTLLMPYEVMSQPVATAPQLIVNVQDCATGIAKNRIDALKQ